MIVAVAIVKGYQQQIKAKITGFSGDIQLSRFDLNNSYETAPVLIDSAMEHKLKSISVISSLQRVAVKAGIIKTEKDFEGIVLKGIGKDFDFAFLKSYIQAGNLPDLAKDTAASDIILSESVCSKLNIKLGDAVRIYFVQNPPRARRFRLVGIYKTGFEDMDELFAYIDIRHIQKLNDWNELQISGYEINLRANDIQTEQKAVDELVSVAPYNMAIKTIQERYPQLFDWLNLLDLNVWVIIILMVIVACINMSTALLILIVERSNMIGMLKALGASNMKVTRIFIYMATFLIAIGLAIGNVVGLTLCYSQQQYGWFTLPESAYYLSKVPVQISTSDVLMINIGAFVVCYLVLLIPSLFVLRITPVKAIRFE
jgi:lipoprotein-releasing system permease protein